MNAAIRSGLASGGFGNAPRKQRDTRSTYDKGFHTRTPVSRMSYRVTVLQII